jgi:hypothetical protein
MPKQRRFDLRRFDSKASNFNLRVLTAKEFEYSVGSPAYDIARAVKAVAGII